MITRGHIGEELLSKRSHNIYKCGRFQEKCLLFGRCSPSCHKSQNWVGSHTNPPSHAWHSASMENHYNQCPQNNLERRPSNQYCWNCPSNTKFWTHFTQKRSQFSLGPSCLSVCSSGRLISGELANPQRLNSARLALLLLSFPSCNPGGK